MAAARADTAAPDDLSPAGPAFLAAGIRAERRTERTQRPTRDPRCWPGSPPAAKPNRWIHGQVPDPKSMSIRMSPATTITALTEAPVF